MHLLVDPLMQDIGEQEFLDRVRQQRTSILQKIDKLDLTVIKYRLGLDSDHGGKKWSSERANEAEKWYKHFLKLRVLEPDTTVMPPKDVDQMWHEHILDTRKYMADCEHVFGRYLHHGPSSSPSTVEDSATTQQVIEFTVSLFQKHFREVPPGGLHWFCWNNCGEQ